MTVSRARICAAWASNSRRTSSSIGALPYRSDRPLDWVAPARIANRRVADNPRSSVPCVETRIRLLGRLSLTIPQYSSFNFRHSHEAAPWVLFAWKPVPKSSDVEQNFLGLRSLEQALADLEAEQQRRPNNADLVRMIEHAKAEIATGGKESGRVGSLTGDTTPRPSAANVMPIIGIVNFSGRFLPKGFAGQTMVGPR